MRQDLFPNRRLKAFLGSALHARRNTSSGFSLIELLILIVIMGTLAYIAIPIYANSIEEARIARAIAEVRTLQTEIYAYRANNQEPPFTLDDIHRGSLPDPWGNTYQYLNYDTATGTGEMRNDRFIVPLNCDFDLYSKGKDGKSVPRLSDEVSVDDIIRANNGTYIGLASEY